MRTVKTASGATAVQVVWSSSRGSRSMDHIGSAHTPEDVEVLKAVARQRMIAAGQDETPSTLPSAPSSVVIGGGAAVALAAFWEVENALAAEPFLAAQLPLEQKSLASRQDAVRIATVQYTAGRRDLLWVSQLQANALQTEGGVIRLGSTLLVNRVRLAQALGSSYDGEPAASVGMARSSTP